MRKIICMLLCFLAFAALGCNHNVICEDTSALEDNNVNNNITNPEQISEELQYEEKDETIQNNKLTEDNLQSVLNVLMTIDNESELKLLEELPLTEELLEECRNDFPYLQDAERITEITVYEYGVNEDAIGCFCLGETDQNIEYYYYVRLEMSEDKIDEIEFTILTEWQLFEGN